jgi:hypothetical protein
MFIVHHNSLSYALRLKVLLSTVLTLPLQHLNLRISVKRTQLSLHSSISEACDLKTYLNTSPLVHMSKHQMFKHVKVYQCFRRIYNINNKYYIAITKVSSPRPLLSLNSIIIHVIILNWEQDSNSQSRSL